MSPAVRDLLEVAIVVATGGMLWSFVARLRAGRVVPPRCRDCGRVVSRAYPRCPRCGGRDPGAAT